jgi:parallel beta-helix repeat protein
MILLSFAYAATVHTVDPAGVCTGNPNCYTTITAAVTAASNGDTINVYAGTYYENVTVSGFDDLHIVGADTTATTLYGALDLGVGGSATPPTAIVNGSGTGYCFGVDTSRDVSVIGFSMTNCPTGIQVFTSTDTVIEGNYITGSVSMGIVDGAGAVTSRITGNSVAAASSIGILLRTSDNPYVADNRVGTSYYGIYVSNTYRAQIVNNRVAFGTGVGITVIGADETRVERNTGSANTGGNLYITSTSTNTSWVGNRLSGSWVDSGVGSAAWDNL